MLSQIQDALNVYLFPFTIAIPIAIVLYLLATRRDDSPPSAAEPPPPEHQRPRVAAAAMSAASAEAASGPVIQQAMARRGLPDSAAAPLRPTHHGHATQAGGAPSGWSATTLPPLLAPSLTNAAHSVRLLVVDDSAVARAKLRRLFEPAGYTIDQASDGLEALDMLGKGRYALMITDLEMPNMNGIELIAAVTGSLETEDMPILAITGHDDLQAKVHECQGLFGIFKKPWNDRELLRRVEALARIQAGSAAQTARH